MKAFKFIDCYWYWFALSAIVLPVFIIQPETIGGYVLMLAVTFFLLSVIAWIMLIREVKNVDEKELRAHQDLIERLENGRQKSKFIPYDWPKPGQKMDNYFDN